MYRKGTVNSCNSNTVNFLQIDRTRPTVHLREVTMSVLERGTVHNLAHLFGEVRTNV